MLSTYAGGHRSTESTSFNAILATFIPTFSTAVVYLTIFVIIRHTFRNIYCPRTYLDVFPEGQRTPSSGQSRFTWLRDLRNIDNKFLLQQQTLDGYLFLRFFKIIIGICFVGCCLTWPILIPVNASGDAGATQLDRISFSNVNDKNKLYAHAVVAWLFLGFVLVLISRERLFFIGLRQAFLNSKENAARLSSRTVLFLAASKEALHDENKNRIFGPEAKTVWPVRDLSHLQSLVDDRTARVLALETSQLLLAQKLAHKKATDPTATSTSSIEKLRQKVTDTVTQIKDYRESTAGTALTSHPAVFVEFSTQAAAQQACQRVAHHHPLQMNPRYIGVQPKEVLWQNLTLEPTLRISQGYLATAFIAATILLWSIPISIVATLSNIYYLTDKVKFLGFINNLPPAILGLLTGFLPPFLMSYFVSYVPFFFRYVAKLSGEPTVPQAELLTQTWFFAFQLIQVFLVTTFSSGAAAVATKIAQEPTQIPAILADNLPMASNFYLSYFILQGTASAAANILNYSDLLWWLFYDKIVDKTPREKYTRFVKMKGIGWGSVYPKFTNMAIIAISYSCIAPLVLGFATIGFSLFYFSYRYNLFYVVQIKVDTKGGCYGRALEHLMAGVYLSELCLIGLFGARKATGPTILTIILFAVTLLYHFTIDRLFSPLELFLPAELEGGSDEEAPLLSVPGDEEDFTTSFVRRLIPGEGGSSATIEDRIILFLSPHRDAYKILLRDTSDPGDLPTYTDEEIKNAYLNPALTSKTPKIWLARDNAGVSKEEIKENEKISLASTDEGASLDEKGRVKWEGMEDGKFEGRVPIFKVPTRY